MESRLGCSCGQGRYTYEADASTAHEPEAMAGNSCYRDEALLRHRGGACSARILVNQTASARRPEDCDAEVTKWRRRKSRNQKCNQTWPTSARMGSSMTTGCTTRCSRTRGRTPFQRVRARGDSNTRPTD